MKKILTTLFTAFVASLMVPVSAWAWKPTEPVKIIIGGPPGVSYETALKKLTAKIEENTGVKFVFENKPGAGQLAAANHFIQQPADGHTLYMPVSGEVFVLAPIDFKDQVKWKLDSFEYVINYSRGYLVLVTHVDTPVSNPKEFVNFVKNSKTPLSIASGVGFQALGYEYMMDAAKLDKNILKQIFYKTATLAFTDVAGKHVEFGLLPSGVLTPALATGKIKVVGIAAESKNPKNPGYELLNTAIPGMDLELIRGIVLPKGAKPEVIKWYNDEFRKALASPEMIEYFSTHNEYINFGKLSPEDYKKIAIESNKKWTPIAEKLSK
jgi:tripartite-type tricarboxylate transporter receptor subunit TctC